jgi:hypothetical protein
MAIQTVQTLLGPFDTVNALGANITFNATVLTGDSFYCTGREILMFNGGAAGGTVTITSVANEKGRTEDITSYTIGANLVAMFGVGLTNKKGWMDSGRYISFVASAITVTCAVVKLPAGYGR